MGNELIARSVRHSKDRGEAWRYPKSPNILKREGICLAYTSPWVESPVLEKKKNPVYFSVVCGLISLLCYLQCLKCHKTKGNKMKISDFSSNKVGGRQTFQGVF